MLAEGGKKRREVHRGRMQGAGLASVTSLRLRQGRPSFLLPRSSPPIHVALTTASSCSARVGQGSRAPLPLTCRYPWQPPPLARGVGVRAPGFATNPTGLCKARGRRNPPPHSKKKISAVHFAPIALSGLGLFLNILFCKRGV